MACQSFGLPSAMQLRRIVARNLRRLRQDRGLSQEGLADRAEINRNYVGMIERCENAATVDTLATALGAKPVECFQEE